MWMQCGCSEVWKSAKKVDLWDFGEARGPQGARAPGPQGARARATPRSPHKDHTRTTQGAHTRSTQGPGLGLGPELGPGLELGPNFWKTAKWVYWGAEGPLGGREGALGAVRDR